MAGGPVGVLPSLLPDPLARLIKEAITSKIVSLLNDRTKSEKPIRRSPDGLFGPGAVSRRVHGDFTTMMVGGVAALLLQMLHPAVLAGVWDHSNFRKDMQGRLRRTARFIARITYGSRAEAEAAIAHVSLIHDSVRGVLPDGMPYAANDPALLAWVHVTAITSFLGAWIRYGEPAMPIADQDRYMAEMAVMANALGAHPIPRSKGEAQRLVAKMRPQLRCDARTREVANHILRPHAANWLGEPVHVLTMQAAIDLLPAWARRMHGLHVSGLSLPLIRTATFGMAQGVRWAFRR